VAEAAPSACRTLSMVKKSGSRGAQGDSDAERLQAFRARLADFKVPR